MVSTTVIHLNIWITSFNYSFIDLKDWKAELADP